MEEHNDNQEVIPLQDLFDAAPWSTLGELAPEATLASVQYAIEIDDMPSPVENPSTHSLS